MQPRWHATWTVTWTVHDDLDSLPSLTLQLTVLRRACGRGTTSVVSREQINSIITTSSHPVGGKALWWGKVICKSC